MIPFLDFADLDFEILSLFFSDSSHSLLQVDKLYLMLFLLVK